MTRVAIVVPGIMGSVLKLGEEVVWPGPPASLFLPYGKMAQLLRDDLRADDCIRSFFVSDQYSRLIKDLETCGFSESDGTLRVAAYDWRKDNADSARTLADHLDAAVATHGPATEITLVAHSMGGLVSRYYLESGRFKDRPGYGNVRRLITLGTPHMGAAVALPVVLGQEKRLFLSKEQVLQMCCDERFPSAYQLLPHRGEPIFVDGRADRELLPLDIYNNEVAAEMGLVRANLDSALRFHDALDPTKRPESVRYFCFTGTRQLTATYARLVKHPSKPLLPEKIEQEDGGDGTVPTWSGFLPGVQRVFVGGEHGTIYQNAGLRRVLAAVLGKDGVLADSKPRLQLAIRDRVVEPDDRVELGLTFGDGRQQFEGALTIERARVDRATGVVTGFDEPTEVHPVRYSGLQIGSMALSFIAPAMRGSYRVAFREGTANMATGSDELIVQEPT